MQELHLTIKRSEIKPWLNNHPKNRLNSHPLLGRSTTLHSNRRWSPALFIKCPTKSRKCISRWTVHVINKRQACIYTECISRTALFLQFYTWHTPYIHMHIEHNLIYNYYIHWSAVSTLKWLHIFSVSVHSMCRLRQWAIPLTLDRMISSFWAWLPWSCVVYLTSPLSWLAFQDLCLQAW